MSHVRLIVMFNLEGATPSETRERFLTALKVALMQAYKDREIDEAVVDELFRAVSGSRSA